MSVNWGIHLDDWEALDSGPPEERACFAGIGIQAHGLWLTEGHDTFANSLRKLPRLSAYHLAEWLAWNWWRLRWEPRSRTAREWSASHRMTTIGGGYIWPNITIFSDGERVALLAKPTDERPQTPFRYIADTAAIVQASEFELEIDSFIDRILQRLDSGKIKKTNLEAVWNGVMEERSTPRLARARKLEALLGQEPDESDSKVLEQLISDAQDLSIGAIEEIAADHHVGGKVATAKELREIAGTKGYEASPRDIVRLASGSGLQRVGQIPAWRYGAASARILREQEGLREKPVSNKELAKLAGVEVAALAGPKVGGTGISFSLDDSPTYSRVVLRSKWPTGRRFEVARLLGDRIGRTTSGRLFPAIRAYTYRQKAQRAFAAEFLSPFEVVDEMLGGDYSMENQQEVAGHFEVSPLTITTLLVNHKRLEREGLEDEIETAA